MKPEMELNESAAETNAKIATGNHKLSSRKMIWAGRILSALPVPLLLFSAIMKLQKPAEVVQGFNHLGIPERLSMGIGLLELTCTILYLIPQTAVLGAILLTGYLGGAILAHLRVGDAFAAQFVFGVVLWGGLFLRDARLRALIPFRTSR